MSRNSTTALAIIVGVACGFTTTVAPAGEWDAGAINKIVIQDDNTISIFKESAQGGSQEDWSNPDACDNPSRAILIMPRTVRRVGVGLVGVGMSSYEQAYAALLGAKLNARKVSVFLDGCLLIGNQTFPLIDAVAVID